LKAEALRIDADRLLRRLDQLAAIGPIAGGGSCRLALTDEDRAGRDLVAGWMRELGLEVAVDPIGNVFGLRRGTEDVAPVMTGSHIDTVRTGGRYDGNLGVLGGLEAVETLNAAGVTTRRPLVVAFFTDEALLREAERRLALFLGELAHTEGVRIATRPLARFAPVTFDPGVVQLVERTAARLGYSCRRMTSGAGHDAQMLARICPAGMIFVPSVKGISHNPAEHTAPADLAAGANVLLHTLLELAA